MKERRPPDIAQPMDQTSTRPIAKRPKDASLGREVQAKIGQQLRAYYDGLLEPTPDRFVDLLRKLDKSSEGQGSSE